MTKRKIVSPPAVVEQPPKNVGVSGAALRSLITTLEQGSPLGGGHDSVVEQHEAGRLLGRKQAADRLRALVDAAPVSVLTLYGVIVDGCWVDIYNHYRIKIDELTQSGMFSVLTMSPHIPEMLCAELHIDRANIVRFELWPQPLRDAS